MLDVWEVMFKERYLREESERSAVQKNLRTIFFFFEGICKPCIGFSYNGISLMYIKMEVYKIHLPSHMDTKLQIQHVCDVTKINTFPYAYSSLAPAICNKEADSASTAQY